MHSRGLQIIFFFKLQESNEEPWFVNQVLFFDN